MIGEPGASVVQIDWVANTMRGDRFEEIWRPAAEAVMDYGATGWALLRSKEDPSRFTQLAAFEDKLSFERYWLSEEVSDAKAAAAGLFQLPILPVWHQVAGAGSLRPEAIEP